MKAKLLIYTLIASEALETAIAQRLPPAGYDMKILREEAEFLRSVQQERQTIDCLILESSDQVVNILTQLAGQPTLLPTIVVQTDQSGDRSEHVADSTEADEADSGETGSGETDYEETDSGETDSGEIEKPPSDSLADPSRKSSSSHHSGTYLETNGSYHSAVIGLSVEHLNQLPAVIDHSIVQFLKLSVTASMPPKAMRLNEEFQQEGQQALKRKQQDLAKKLNERLGYVGVYYKRDSEKFLRHMTPAEKKEFLGSLRRDYRVIVLSYFAGDSAINQKIDAYVNTAFLADVPTAQIVEIHMDLMDDFAKQLQIEGRSEEILLDYRLTLIDLLANLCEIYRRSIPRESPEKQ
ncbi:MAG: circadian clock protein KaiA [Leptolyngbyaceae bacterium]|nr:circadian clock protein KaiA [Leptolyngbyaceae bacterium]